MNFEIIIPLTASLGLVGYIHGVLFFGVVRAPDRIKQSRKFRHNFGMLAVEIPPLRNVISEVEEFPRTTVQCVSSFFLEPLGLLIVVSTRRIDKNPVSLSDGEPSAGTVVHCEFAHRSFRLAPQ